MFNKESEANNVQGAETVIGPSIKVKGDFHGEGDIIIEGSVEGEISTKQFLSVGANAKIIANVSANNGKIAGQVTGDVNIDGYLEILKTAVIKGNITTNEISIEKGATVHGRLSMTKENNSHFEDKK